MFAFGVHMTIYANIGFASWNSLGMWIYMSAEQCCGPRDLKHKSVIEVSRAIAGKKFEE